MLALVLSTFFSSEALIAGQAKVVKPRMLPPQAAATYPSDGSLQIHSYSGECGMCGGVGDGCPMCRGPSSGPLEGKAELQTDSYRGECGMCGGAGNGCPMCGGGYASSFGVFTSLISGTWE